MEYQLPYKIFVVIIALIWIREAILKDYVNSMRIIKNVMNVCIPVTGIPLDSMPT